MHGHTSVQVIHRGLLPLSECHYRFPVPSWSWYYFKHESLLCYSFLQYAKPGMPPYIVFGTTFTCNEGGSWKDFDYGALATCYWQRKIEILKEKSVSVALCTPQIPHGLAWDLWWTTLRGTGFSPSRPTLDSPPVSVIPPMLHTHSMIYHRQEVALGVKMSLVVRGKLTVLYHNALFAVRHKCFHFK